MFPLPKPYSFLRNERKERDLSKKEFMPEILDETSYVSLTNKENNLLNKNFGFKIINELVNTLNNTKTEEEYTKLFESIISRRNIFKKIS